MSTAIEQRRNSKREIGDLAIFGGRPAFDAPLYVGRPNIGDRQKFFARVNKIFDNRWLTNDGPYVKELEKRIADLIGVKHCIAMCNATVALEIAIRALGMTGEVIVPSFTFIATAHALQWQEITPVFCDIDLDTHTIDARRVEELITPRTTGIIGVHVWGRACEIDALADIAQRHKLRLLFDAAHAFACSYKGQTIGRFGDAEVFSFHATKFFNSAEGGAVTTNNDDLAQKIRLMKNFGFSDYDRVTYIGTNGKMNEISAAMGLTSLESIQDFIQTNRKNYEHYRKELSGLDYLRLVPFDNIEDSNCQYVVLEMSDASPITRNELVEILHAENVIARRYFYPGCHRMEPYRTLYPDASLHLTSTEAVANRVLTLPTGTAASLQQISNVCQLIKCIFSHSSEIRQHLKLKTD